MLLTKEEFETIVKTSTKPVFVDFKAEWCGPCKMISPLVDQLSNEYGDQIGFYKIDVDECKEIAQSLNIKSIPTLMLFAGGELKVRQAGALSKSKIVDMFRDQLV